MIFRYILALIIFLSTNYVSFSQCGSCNLCNEKKVAPVNLAEDSKEAGSTTVDKNTNNDEFEEVGEDEEFDDIDESSVDDEEFDSIGDGDEFEDAGDEFEDAGDDEFSAIESSDGDEQIVAVSDYSMLYWPLGSILFTIISGILVRFIPGRKMRPLFLIASIIFLGFYNGACPCPIMSFESVFLSLFGADNISWQAWVWFLGLIPVTYLFGKVWCGWVCHLGALQEFLHVSDKFKFLNGKKAQITMRWMRYTLVLALMVQLFLTTTNEYCKIDPFKAIFNMGFNVRTFDESGQIIIWSLVGLLILTSLFIERPFCKSACPIGLVLGWISKIPGASVLGNSGSCKSCALCQKACRMDAIDKNKKVMTLDNNECIACGDCIEACKRSGISFFRKNKQHKDIAVFTYEDSNTNSCGDNCDCSAP